MKLVVAGAQIPVRQDIALNAKAINRAIDFAVSKKADILLTPEGSLSGYRHDFDRGAVMTGLQTVIARASASGLGLALGTCFAETDGNYYNQIRFYDTDGAYMGFHGKILRCASVSDPSKGEANLYACAPLRVFTFRGITIGGLICNDLWANPECTPTPDPHLTQQLADMGAKIVFHAVNGGRDSSEFSTQVTRKYHETNLQMRARAGSLWVVTADNCYPPDIPTSSPGGVVNPEGGWAVKAADKGEQFFVYKIED